MISNINTESDKNARGKISVLGYKKYNPMNSMMPVCHSYYFLRGKDAEMDLEISLQATSYGQHPKNIHIHYLCNAWRANIYSTLHSIRGLGLVTVVAPNVRRRQLRQPSGVVADYQGNHSNQQPEPPQCSQWLAPRYRTHRTPSGSHARLSEWATTA